MGMLVFSFDWGGTFVTLKKFNQNLLEKSASEPLFNDVPLVKYLLSGKYPQTSSKQFWMGGKYLNTVPSVSD